MGVRVDALQLGARLVLVDTVLEIVGYLPCVLIAWGLGYCAWTCCNFEKLKVNVHQWRAPYT
jgi:uncharacterized membrane protein